MDSDQFEYLLRKINKPAPWYKTTLPIVVSIFAILAGLWAGAGYLFLPNVKAAQTYETKADHEKDAVEADRQRGILLNAVAENQKAIGILNVEQQHQNEKIEANRRPKRRR